MLELSIKFKINKLSFDFAIVTMLLVINCSAIAMTSDTEQSIYIRSNTQSIDMKKNIVTFTGNVVITQGSIKIHAEKVVISPSSKENNEEILDGYGNPITFYQTQDNGKSIKGYAMHMRYKLAKNLMILAGNACLKQLDCSISGDKIIYLVKERTMHAYSENGKPVTTILVPYQLQKKQRVD